MIDLFHSYKQKHYEVAHTFGELVHRFRIYIAAMERLNIASRLKLLEDKSAEAQKNIRAISNYLQVDILEDNCKKRIRL
jgi:hypothetical protein